MYGKWTHPGSRSVRQHDPHLGGRTGPRTRYVDQVGSDGWVQARFDSSGALQPLAKYTAVQVLESRNGRTYFKVTDGPSEGKALSMSDSNAAVHLGSTAPKDNAASIVITYGKYVEG